MSGPTVQHAIWYAARGVPVFPLKPGTKVPATRNGFKDAAVEPHAVHALFRDGKVPFNLGLATGHRFDVVDVDIPWIDAGHVIDAVQMTGCDWYGVVETPSGGCHIYVPTGTHGGGNWAKKVPDSDYRGVGGYVVAPPSRIEHGAWRWMEAPNL